MERELADHTLENSPTGSWLLRYSSVNRTFKNAKDLGLTFYVLSYLINSEVKHSLFLHRLGFGWSKAFHLKTSNNDLIESWEDVESFGVWSPWFIDFIDQRTRELNLELYHVKKGYIKF